LNLLGLSLVGTLKLADHVLDFTVVDGLLLFRVEGVKCFLDSLFERELLIARYQVLELYIINLP
jgi:hypothetical protein